MAFVDAFLLAVPKARLDDYRALAALAGQVWMENGALSYVETIGVDVPYGTTTSFPRAVLAKDDEIVVLSWIVYRSREDRDAIVPKVMADPRIVGGMKDMPFDGQRLMFGGFEPIVELGG